jgi:hypothetical protein
MDQSIVFGADPSALAALLLGSHTKNMRVPRTPPSQAPLRRSLTE